MLEKNSENSADCMNDRYICDTALVRHCPILPSIMPSSISITSCRLITWPKAVFGHVMRRHDWMEILVGMIEGKMGQ